MTFETISIGVPDLLSRREQICCERGDMCELIYSEGGIWFGLLLGERGKESIDERTMIRRFFFSLVAAISRSQSIMSGSKPGFPCMKEAALR